MKQKANCIQIDIFHALFFFVVCIITRMTLVEATPIAVRVGVILDESDYVGEMGLNCISMALSDFYDKNRHYKTRLVLNVRDSKANVVGAAAAAVDLLKNVEVQAIIGPIFSTQANFLIALGEKAQVPIITFSATSPSLSSIPSSYFFRASLDDSSQVQAIAGIIQAFGWREVVPIYEDNEFGEGILPYLTDALEQVNARVPYRSVIPFVATDSQIVAELYKLMTIQTRVFIIHMRATLGSRLFIKAEQLGMMSEDYVWIITDGMANEVDSMDPSVIEVMSGVIGVKPHTPKTKELENFKIRYKIRLQQNNPMALSKELNIFGLWAYDSAIALAMAAEKAVLTNAKFDEADISRNSTDLEAFGVSNAGPKLIQALSGTTFIGLSGKFRSDNRQLRSPPYEIVNVVSPAVRVVGYWRKEYGITRKLKSTDANAKTYSTSKFNLGSTVWPGDKTSPSKGWVIPTNGKKLKVGVPVNMGFTEFVRVNWNADNSTTVEGYCIDVFDAVMAALPYGVPYEYIPFATPDHKMAGTFNDLTYQVYLGNYDVVAGDVTISANRSQYVDFTLPYLPSGVSMVVPIKEDMSQSAWVFVTPLTWELWLTSFCSFVFIGCLIWILEHRINEDFRGPPWHQVGMIFWFAFSTMVFSHKERVISNLARFVLIIWFLVVLILTQSYTASLASMLTVQKLQPKVTDINMLLKNKDYVGCDRASFTLEYLKKMNFHDSRIVEFDTPEEMDRLLSKGSENGGIAAAFHEIPYIKLFLSKYRSKYIMVDPTYKADGFGFVFPIGSPLVRDVSRAILNVIETTKVVEIERKWLSGKINCPGPSALSSQKSLGLSSFWGLFLIVGIIEIVVFIIYVIMFLREHWHVVERSDPESRIRKKMAELLRRFDNRDLSSHTFKNSRLIEKDNKFRDDCMGMAMYSSPQNHHLSPSDFVSVSLPTNDPPSPIFSSPRGHTTNFQGDQGNSMENSIANKQGEASKTINQEIALVNQNENDQTGRSTSLAM